LTSYDFIESPTTVRDLFILFADIYFSIYSAHYSPKGQERRERFANMREEREVCKYERGGGDLQIRERSRAIYTTHIYKMLFLFSLMISSLTFVITTALSFSGISIGGVLQGSVAAWVQSVL